MKRRRTVKNILCFGDSNTYGLIPDGSGRYSFSVRYPGKLQAILGDNYHIIEEGCPGRTTVFEDPLRPYIKGLDYITPCLKSHTPLDYVVIMLGTNDCKSNYGASSSEIASGLSAILDRIQNEVVPVPKVLIIAPIHLGKDIGKPGFDPEFSTDSIAVSQGLAEEYRLLAHKKGCVFLAASAVAKASSLDQEHLDEAGHQSIAIAVAKKVRQKIGG